MKLHQVLPQKKLRNSQKQPKSNNLQRILHNWSKRIITSREITACKCDFQEIIRGLSAW